MLLYTTKINIPSELPICNTSSPPPQVIKTVRNRLIHNGFHTLYFSNGAVKTVPDAKFGNAVYGHRSRIKAFALQDKMNSMYRSEGVHQSNSMFATLTTGYTPDSPESTLDAQALVKKAFPKLERKLRKAGMKDFIACFESHEKGGCHIHLIMIFDQQFHFFRDTKGKLRHGTWRDNLKSLWKNALGVRGNVDLQGMDSSEACGYILKELIKSYSCEKALKRIEKGEPLLKNDSNRIWLTWLVEKTRMRTLQKSKGFALTDEDIEEAKESEQDSRLDSYETNSTEEIPELIATLEFSSFQVHRLPWFLPWTGRVDPDSPMYRELWSLCPVDQNTRAKATGVLSAS